MKGDTGDSDKTDAQNRMRKRAIRTRNQLLQAALTLFNERGVELTTVEDITERADLGKGTFYRYFKSKKAMLVALTQQGLSRLIAVINKKVAAPQSAQDVLQDLVQAHRAFFTENPQGFWLLFQERSLLHLEPAEAAVPGHPFTEYLAAMEKHLAPFVSDPGRTLKVRRVACSLAGLLSGFLSFARMGLSADDVQALFGTLGTLYVGAAAALLKDDGKPPAAPPPAKAAS